MPDRPAPAPRIRWAELAMLMPMALLLPFALVITLLAVQRCGGWGRPVFVLSFTLLPAIVAVRHLPRMLRAAFPRHAVSHVQ